MPSIDRPKAPVHDRPAPVRPHPGPTDSPPSPDPTPPTPADVARWLALFTSPDVGIEIRAPGTIRNGRKAPENVVERFPGDDVRGAARLAHSLSGHAPGIFFVLNGIKPEALKAHRRPHDRVRDEGEPRRYGATTGDVAHRRFMLVDFDSKRPKDSNATEGEKAAAEALMVDARQWLKDQGWPEPIVADSGNGFHLIFGLDLPNDDASRALIKGALEAIAAAHRSQGAEVDTGVFDAVRLTKCYGTLARKGPHSAERPHRFSRVIDHPDQLTAVRVDQLAALVAEGKPAPPADVRRRPGGGRRADGLDPVERAGRYLDACEPAVSGKRGHVQTLKACRVGPGFDLPPDTAFRLVRDRYSPRCDPPWSETEVRHKVDDAYKNAGGRRGFLLDVDLKPRGTNGRGPGGGIGHPMDDGRPPGDHPPSRPGAQPPARPTIIVGVDMHRVIDECESAIAEDSNIFTRSHALVRVLMDSGEVKRHHPERPAGTPVIAPVEEATIVETLTRHADFVKHTTNRDGDPVTRPVLPPPLAVSGLRARGVWPSVRPLEGIIEAPTIRKDGTILDRPGWDERTGLLLVPGEKFDPIPDRPTREDAKYAAEFLLDLVADVPFKDQRHSAAWLAGLLTVVARHAVDGPTPLFVFDANLRSVGKSLLCDLIYSIAAGRTMPRKAYPEDEAEMRKVLTSVAMAGDRVTMLDNIPSGGMVGGPSLDIVLSGPIWTDRLLSTNRNPELPWRSVLFATGNNIAIKADTFSRSVISRIESEERRPEQRKDFKVDASCKCGCGGSIVKHANNGRAAYLTAALTILRAHALAGRTAADSLTTNRFPAWRSVIQAAVHWATGVDPCETTESERATDREETTAEALVLGWSRLLVLQCEDRMSISSAVQILERGEIAHEALRELFLGWSRDNRLPSINVIGRRMRPYLRRPTPHGSLDTVLLHGISTWFIRPPKSAGSGAIDAAPPRPKADAEAFLPGIGDPPGKSFAD